MTTLQNEKAARLIAAQSNKKPSESAADNLGQPKIVVKSKVVDSSNPTALRAAYHSRVIDAEFEMASDRVAPKSAVLPPSREAASEASGAATNWFISIGSSNGEAILIPREKPETVLKWIRSDRYREKTERYRSKFAEALRDNGGDYGGAKRSTTIYKTCLEAALWSGEFRAGSARSNNNLLTHSGLLCADLDRLGDRLDEVRAKLKATRHVWAIFVSPTGDGLKAVFRITPDKETHYGSFLAVAQHVKGLTGIDIDESGKDPARLCYLPCDPDLYHNPDAIEIESLPEPQKPEREKADTQGAANVSLRERIATELLGELTRDDNKEGYFCVCPGEDKHTMGTEPKHCIVYLSGAPTIKCQHNSCAKIIEEKNHELRSEIGKAESVLACPRNDLEYAIRFAHTFGSNLRYVRTWQTWFQWDKTRWKRDTDGAVMRLAQTLPNVLLNESSRITSDDDRRKKIAGAALRLGEAARLRAMIDLAGAQLGIAANPGMFDADPWLLCVRNGVVDLRTGAFRESQKSDYITKQAGVSFDPGARCPLWIEHLKAVFAGDESLVSFLQHAVGYSLTGDTREHKLFFLYGHGANGKSTTMETIQYLLGDYAQKAPASLFMIDKYGREPQQEIARLMGARLVIGSEIEEGGKLAESRVKDMTGGDTLTGRFLYSHAFDFEPTHKLWIFGNHKPDVPNNDNGIWRRMCLIPFNVEFKKSGQDRSLKQKLRSELAGILNWAIDGCAAWERRGLGVPQIVTAATDEYRDSEDELGEFIREECEVGPYFREGKMVLHEHFRHWATQRGVKMPLPAKKFGKRIGSRPGISEEKDGVMYWTGIQLKRHESTPEDLEKDENVVDFAKESMLRRAAKSAA